jgi:hypothetical protein
MSGITFIMYVPETFIMYIIETFILNMDGEQTNENYLLHPQDCLQTVALFFLEIYAQILSNISIIKNITNCMKFIPF